MTFDGVGLFDMGEIEIAVEGGGRPNLTRLDAAMIGWVNGEEIGCLSVLEVAYEVLMQRRLVAFDGEVVMGKALGNQGSQRACAASIRHRP